MLTFIEALMVLIGFLLVSYGINDLSPMKHFWFATLGNAMVFFGGYIAGKYGEGGK